MTQQHGEQRWIAHALPIRTGRVLLLHRNPHGELGDLWDIPGGSVGPGETPAQTARREVNEETGLDVMVADELTHFVGPDGDGDGGSDIHTVTFVCFENALDRDVSLTTAEHYEYGWMTYAEAVHIPLVWHVRRTLDHAESLGLLS
ncbi:NUDIX hydrolase [Nocardia bovistercoris]|uniref:NUDIX hydrolase n=1 Tax=Nocardia bovistercoris TaxID=2785916 RepID=A0A931IEM7_9NOCA|nr:NUDIX hydrolase [Nocardia bovistercoris]MBH0778980.1 NUDIX hydrolase [Nocardia bovistercoris]